MRPHLDEPWRIQLFGRLQATRADEKIIRFRSQKAGTLLGYLAFHLRRHHLRETLIELLWPECEPAAGRQRLNQLLSSLRRQLEPPGAAPGSVIQTERDWVWLNPAAVVTDVAEYQEALRKASQATSPEERARWLARAVEQYHSEVLAGYPEAWIAGEQAQLAATHFAALRELVQLLQQAGEWSRAIQHARRAVGLDPLQEEAHDLLIRLLADSGDPRAALREYNAWKRLLAQELDQSPSPELQTFIRGLGRGRGTDRGPTAVARPSAQPRGGAGVELDPTLPLAPVGSWSEREASLEGDSAPRSYLPPRLTRFFGREEELAQLDALLRGAEVAPPLVRLLTLTGPGGSGKTRLAIELAERLQAAWQEDALPRRAGPWFVPLVDLSDPDLIWDRTVTVLRLRRSKEMEPREQVAAFLSRQPSLVILDNFEHLLAGAVELEALLAQVPSLVVVVTSRRRLGLPGEREFPVPPLLVPEGAREREGSLPRFGAGGDSGGVEGAIEPGSPGLSLSHSLTPSLSHSPCRSVPACGCSWTGRSHRSPTSS